MPPTPQWTLSLAMISLQRGQFEDAVLDARRALEVLPVSRDAMGGPSRLALLAEAHAAAGHADSALAQLRTLVSLPASPSGGQIELAPGSASLGNDPRFKEIMKRARR